MVWNGNDAEDIRPMSDRQNPERGARTNPVHTHIELSWMQLGWAAIVGICTLIAGVNDAREFGCAAGWLVSVCSAHEASTLLK
jgi:hypothetical protein